jgi:hypothetical protein
MKCRGSTVTLSMKMEEGGERRRWGSEREGLRIRLMKR